MLFHTPGYRIRPLTFTVEALHSNFPQLPPCWSQKPKLNWPKWWLECCIHRFTQAGYYEFTPLPCLKQDRPYAFFHKKEISQTHAFLMIGYCRIKKKSCFMNFWSSTRLHWGPASYSHGFIKDKALIRLAGVAKDWKEEYWHRLGLPKIWKVLP